MPKFIKSQEKLKPLGKNRAVKSSIEKSASVGILGSPLWTDALGLQSTRDPSCVLSNMRNHQDRGLGKEAHDKL